MSELSGKVSNMQSLLESILARLSEDRSRKPVALVTESPAHFPPVAVDEQQMLPVVSDLVDRVLSWTDRQEIRIQARVVPSGGLPFSFSANTKSELQNGAQGPWALLSITDRHAPFLPEQEQQKSTRPKKQELEHIQESAASTLADYGGTVWVELADNEGIQVWIALPLQAETHSDADLSRIRETVDTRLEAGADSTPKILLQAESEPLRGMLAENLIEGGYDVVSAQESVDVLRLARREIPDLIILDLQSRNPSAMDLALILRGERDFSTIPMLFLTEIAGPGIGRRMDTVDFLVQPQGADAILQTVDQVLRKGLRPAERIMVVEQDDGLREEMLQTIQAQGYPVVEARSAEEALALAERVDIRLVLANYNLAHARDYWLVRQLRQLSKQIEIYLMTEGAQSIDAQVALRKGVTGYGDTGRLRELLAKADEETNSPDEGD
ncbi:MAG: response regulator [Anaerolineales bacterium]